MNAPEPGADVRAVSGLFRGAKAARLVRETERFLAAFARYLEADRPLPARLTVNGFVGCIRRSARP